MSATFKMDGFADLDRVLAEIADPKAATRLARTVGRRAMKQFASDLIAAAPAGTRSTLRRRKRKDGSIAEADYGRLRSNIRVRLVRTGEDTKAVVFTVSTNAAFWGWMQEFGTPGHPTNPQPARPFFRPAWEANKMGMLNSVADGMGAGVMRLAKRRGVNATGRSI